MAALAGSQKDMYRGTADSEEGLGHIDIYFKNILMKVKNGCSGCLEDQRVFATLNMSSLHLPSNLC